MKKFLFALCLACVVAATSAQFSLAQASLDVRVSQGLDDAEEFTGETSQGPAGTVYLDSSDLELFEDAGTLQVVGLRFENVTIPQGAVVTAAYLQFTVDETTDTDTSITIQGEASDNAALFAEAPDNISGRQVTTAAVTWSPAPWTTVNDAGADQQSPELATVVQEIVDRPGWQSGNAMAFVLSGTGHRVARAFDGKAKEAPLLHIDYETAAGAATPAETTPTETTPAETTPAESAPEPTPAEPATPESATPAPATPEVPATPETTPEPTTSTTTPEAATPEPTTPATLEPTPTAPQPAQPVAPQTPSSEAPRARQVRYAISPVDNSRVRGSLFVADYGDNSLVLTLFVTGQAASDTYGVELVKGKCGSGETLLALEPAEGSKGGLSVTTVQMSFVALTNADLHVNLYSDASGSGAAIACGEVGAL